MPKRDIEWGEWDQPVEGGVTPEAPKPRPSGGMSRKSRKGSRGKGSK